jgi:acyl dehydratase
MSTQPHRWFEDFAPGQVLEGGDFTMTEAEIVDFARRYDPQPFHLDHAAARASMFGELVASGWNTAAVAMRMMVDHFFGAGGSMGSPGIDELRWPRPVRVGDRLRLRVTVEDTRASRSKPDRGLVHFRSEMLNQDDQAVLTLRGMAFFRMRPR